MGNSSFVLWCIKMCSLHSFFEKRVCVCVCQRCVLGLHNFYHRFLLYECQLCMWGHGECTVIVHAHCTLEISNIQIRLEQGKSVKHENAREKQVPFCRLDHPENWRWKRRAWFFGLFPLFCINKHCAVVKNYLCHYVVLRIINYNRSENPPCHWTTSLFTFILVCQSVCIGLQSHEKQTSSCWTSGW